MTSYLHFINLFTHLVILTVQQVIYIYKFYYFSLFILATRFLPIPSFTHPVYSYDSLYKLAFFGHWPQIDILFFSLTYYL